MGVEVCTACDLAVAYCKCAAAPPPPPTQGDGAESSLNVRIRDAKGVAMQIRADDPWKLHCGYCNAVLDRPGCDCQRR
jgi:hypothetical protein